MLVAKVAFPVAVLFLAGLAQSEERPHYSHLSRLLRSGHNRSSRQAQPDWYFEQCRFVDAWKEQLGHVSVLAFLDPDWQYSFRQTVMLELLISRFRKSGLPDIQFFVITPPSDRTQDQRDEDDLEIEAWQEIGAKYEMEGFVDDHFLKGNGSEIIFLRDDPQSRMWERFRASRDQVIIIDRCGKLTYHVIVPWSILYFPYVKAAILSTYREDPCGGCNPTIYQAPNRKDHVVGLTNDTDEEEASSRSETNGANPVWTTERSGNPAIHNDESSPEEEREMNTASSVLLEGITDNADHLNLSSTTEPATYQYDKGATESWLNGGPPDAEGTRDQEDPTDSEGSGTVSGEIAVTFEPQRDTFPPEEAGSHSQTSVNDDSLTPTNYGDTTDRILLLDEPAAGETESDSTTAGERTTTSDSVDETQGGNATPEDARRLGEDALMPLRIIMRAPHVHKNGRKMKKHAHLILKTGDPDFHGHLDSGVDVAPPMDSWQDADSRITSSEEYDWRTTEVEKENANQKYTFDRDESPGLYGEIADYWRSQYNNITGRNKTFNDTDNNSTISYNEEHHTNISDHAMSFSKSSEESYSIANATRDLNTESSIDPQNIVGSNTIESSKPINMNDYIDGDEEIEHYNKLLTWIDYRLD